MRPTCYFGILGVGKGGLPGFFRLSEIQKERGKATPPYPEPSGAYGNLDGRGINQAEQ